MDEFRFRYGRPKHQVCIKTERVMRSADNRLAFPTDGLFGLSRPQWDVERYVDPILDAVVEAVRGVVESR